MGLGGWLFASVYDRMTAGTKPLVFARIASGCSERPAAGRSSVGFAGSRARSRSCGRPSFAATRGRPRGAEGAAHSWSWGRRSSRAGAPRRARAFERWNKVVAA